MRSLGVLLITAVMAMTLSGCPFVSKVPLGQVQHHPLDVSVFGDWLWENPQDKKQVVHAVVLPFNDTEYFVEWFDGDRAPLRLRAYRVDIDGQAYINFNDLKATGSPEYFFAKYELSGDHQLTIRFIGEKGVPKGLATDAKGLVDYVRTHLTDPSLEDDFSLAFRRAKPDEIVRGRLRRD